MKNKILLIDDDKDVLKSLESLLKKAEYDVTAVDDSLRAIEMAKKNVFELIVTDIRMPDLNGIEAIKRIKADQIKIDGPKSEFMVITGYADDDAPKESALLGITNFMIKPFDADVFLGAVRNCLEGKKEELPKLEERRIKETPIKLPNKYFSIEKTILLKETNLMGNTYFANYVVWQGEARETYLLSHPRFPEEFAKNQHIKMITHSVYHRFIHETTFGDVVQIKMTSREIKHCSFIMVYRYYNKRTTVFLGEGWQRITFADLRTGNLTVIPIFIQELILAICED